MTQTISRTYSSHDNAEAAVNELKRVGFGDTAIHVVEPADRSDDEMMASIEQGGVRKTHATVYADAIRRGETLVSVLAPFGLAGTITTILDKFNPTETDLGDQGYEKTPYDPAAPLSSACGWRVLSDNPTPLSSALGWPTLSTNRPRPKPAPTLIDNPAPLSKKFGMPLLSNNPAPLSKRAGWRLLWENPAPLSTRVGWPVLAKEQKPPPTRFGLPLLSDNPAPLSSLLNWKLLSNNPAPLSKLFNWRVLSKDRSE